MKIDRLYAITIFLLNHGKTTAAELSKKFEVSVRTIQRDMDSLCQAGIPIIAETGSTGGYYLPDTFCLDAQTATEEDYNFILTALKGLATAMNNPKIDATVEKISALSKYKNESIILDFSVLREGDNMLLQLLQTAVQMKHPVCFEYTNANNITRNHVVEPIAVIYRWYAWYLLAYSNAKHDYRTYKLVRMRNAEIIDSSFEKEHDDAEAILRENDKREPQKCTAITIRCNSNVRAKVIEYLNGKITHEYENGECDMILNVVETEQFWFGMLLSLGDSVEIIEPMHIKCRVLEAAEKIISLYKKL